MRYGFVVDNRKCIGCHACSVACKAENQVPLGVFRTWVKSVEKGRFPDTRRHFQVTRCNHCDNPPCVAVCPVGGHVPAPGRDRRLRPLAVASVAKPASRRAPTTPSTSTRTGGRRPSATSAPTGSKSGWSRPASWLAPSTPSWPATSTTPPARSPVPCGPSRSRCTPARVRHPAQALLRGCRGGRHRARPGRQVGAYLFATVNPAMRTGAGSPGRHGSPRRQAQGTGCGL